MEKGKLVCEMANEEYRKYIGRIYSFLPFPEVIEVERVKDKKGKKVFRLYSHNPELVKKAIESAK